MVSGPDFDPQHRWRRTPDAPWVSPIDFANGFVRRIEAPCRVDWRAASMVRHVCFKHVAEHTMASCGTFSGMRSSAVNTTTDEYVKAARNLSHQLYHGFVGTGIHRMPIAGDTTKLQHAHGLSPLERRLARAQTFLAEHLGGTQAVRRLMGHAQFGARVVYGDCIFLLSLQTNTIRH